MAGAIDDEIAVELDGTRLLAFTWQGRHYTVRSAWVTGTPPTRWWDGEGERTYIRAAARGHVFELYFDHEHRRWVLARRLS